jgi:L,D-transpeptidase catalytic domain
MRAKVLGGIVLLAMLVPASAHAEAGTGQAGAKQVPAKKAGPVIGASVREISHGSQTSWAHTARVAPIRRAPRPDARQIVSTHYLTEDGYPEVYIVLVERTLGNGQTWMKVRVPMRPNGRVGWVRSYGLGPVYSVDTRLVVNRQNGFAALYKHGRRIWHAPIGTGKKSTPTPAGHFWIREKFRNQDANGLYGPVAFGTSGYSVLSEWPGGGVIGIHGTDEPDLIPGKPSHGCIRVRNHAVLRLYHLMPVGTPVRIRNSLDS